MRRRQFVTTMAAAPAGLWLPAAPVKLRVSANPHPTTAPVHLALEEGYFAAEGLDVEIVPIVGYSQTIPVLASGRVDASFLSISAGIVNAIARGARVRLVAAREAATPACSTISILCGLRESFPQGLGDLRLLRGKRVCVSGKGNISEFSFDLMLKAAAMTAEELEIVNLESANSTAALLAGKVDAILTNMFYNDAVAAIAGRLVTGLRLADVAPGLQYTYLAYGRSLLDGDLDVGVRLLRAFTRGVRAYLQGTTPRFLEQIARSNNMDLPQLLKSACRSGLSPDGAFDKDSLRLFAEWAVGRGYCEENAKTADFTDTRFLARLRDARSSNPPAAG